jgi:hypothetical protein
MSKQSSVSKALGRHTMSRVLFNHSSFTMLPSRTIVSSSPLGLCPYVNIAPHSSQSYTASLIHYTLYCNITDPSHPT